MQLTFWQVFKTKKFKDSNDVFYAIVVGEHGDEMEAKNLALSEARLQFTTKGSSMVESAVKKDGTRSMNDRVGSLDVGKDADIVIWDGPLFDIMTRTEVVIIDGKVVHKK